MKIKGVNISRILGLIHIELMSLVKIESLDKKKYIIVAINDFSCFTWVCFLREKLYAFYFFSFFCLKVQIDVGNKIVNIMRLRTDHVKEFENLKYTIFCKKHGVDHEFSALIKPNKIV